MRGQQTKKPTTPLNGAISRSVPGSPAMVASRSGQATPNAPRSAPAAEDGKVQKLEALKKPLLHSVAIRPMSLKFLANKIVCSQEECKQVLEKIGKPARLDPDKWDLSDKAFKDLDVWPFPYELDDDRELAIEHAVSAYDRMRLSRDDKLWQMLLPKEERGKGKILSKLQLHQGPIQQSNTPRIHVQKTTESQVSDDLFDDEGDEKHRLAPSDATPMARSQSNDQMKKKRTSGQEAQSKRLLSTKPKKATPASQAKDTTKKKVTKKGASAGPNVKSAEFVHESDEDEDEEMRLGATSAPKPTVTETPETDAKSLSKKPSHEADTNSLSKKPPQETTAKSLPKKSSPDDQSTIKELQQLEKDRKQARTSSDSILKPNGSIRSPPTVGTPNSRHRLSDASQGSGSSSKLSRQRTTSSPLKPSPLGSSPPTNASDLENDNQLQPTSNSSTSSTPLMSQARNSPTSSMLRPDAAKRLPAPAESTSDRALKRKANDIDSEIHNHNVPLMNGHSIPSAKRAKTSAPSPPALTSSSSDSSPISDGVLVQAQRFKEFYVDYERLYQEISSQANPPQEKVDGLLKMHQRVQSMKHDLARAGILH